jgi:hypothetical protein
VLRAGTVFIALQKNKIIMETTTVAGLLVTGVFNDKDSANHAYTALRNRGYTSDQIHLFMSDDTRKKHFSHEVIKTGNKAIEGTGAGAAIGGTAGAIAAVLAAVGTSVLIPGLGFIIAGPIVAALAGAGAGGLAGSLIGALVGAGIPEEKAIIYEKTLNDGNIVLGVHVRSNEEAALVEQELRRFNAYDIHR